MTNFNRTSNLFIPKILLFVLIFYFGNTQLGSSQVPTLIIPDLSQLTAIEESLVIIDNDTLPLTNTSVEQTDLEISIATTELNPALYSTVPVTVSIKNNSEIPAPVCGINGVTYPSPCEADCAGVTWTTGICDLQETETDLSLTLTTTDVYPVIYSRIPLTVNIQNTSNVAAENIQVRLLVCGTPLTGFGSANNLVYATTDYEATKGTYDYLNQNWELENLAANSSASLTIQVFNLSIDEITITAHITRASPNDIDSTPGFNPDDIGACIAAEDDEAVLKLNGIQICDCPTDEYLPVCGSDGNTYDNACEGECVGVTWEEGECANPNNEITCGEITLQYGAGTIDIVGQQGEDYFFKVHRRSPVWEYVFECNGKCGFGQTIRNLEDGTYYVDVYNKSWHLLCDDIEVVLTGGAFQTPISEKCTTFKQNTGKHLVGKNQSSIRFYPNPASELLTIELGSNLPTNSSLYFSDGYGRLVEVIALQEGLATIPLTAFINGVYQVSVIADGQVISNQKLVVVK